MEKVMSPPDDDPYFITPEQEAALEAKDDRDTADAGEHLWEMEEIAANLLLSSDRAAATKLREAIDFFAQPASAVAWRYRAFEGNDWVLVDRDYSQGEPTIVADMTKLGYEIEPLFTTPPRSDKANGERAAALEEAAGVADAHAKAWGLAMGTGATEIAKAIRALSASPAVPNTVGEDIPNDVRSFVFAILGADTWLEAGSVWESNPEQRKAAHTFFDGGKP